MRSNPVLIIIFITVAVILFKLAWAFLSDALDNWSLYELIPYATTLIVLYLFLSWLGFLPFWAGLAAFILVPAVWIGIIFFTAKEQKSQSSQTPHINLSYTKKPSSSAPVPPARKVLPSTQPTIIVASTATNTESNLSLKCPECSSVMILRTAKRGKNRGKSFYGCLNFPYCKGTRSFIRND